MLPQDRPRRSCLRARVPSPKLPVHASLSISANLVSHKPFPTLPQQATCPLTHKPSHQLLQFLALLHPLCPGGLMTSDPRRWIIPFSCLSPPNSLYPHTWKGEILKSLEGGGLLSKAGASGRACMTGLSSGSRMWPQVGRRV